MRRITVSKKILSYYSEFFRNNTIWIHRVYIPMTEHNKIVMDLSFKLKR